MKFCVALFVAVFSISVTAQQPQPAPPKVRPVQQAPQAPMAPAAPAVPAAAQVISDMSAGGQPVNIRLDLSVIDQKEGGIAEPKTLMVILADRATGQTRAAYESRGISVDARPTIADGLIRVSLSVRSSELRVPDPTVNWTNSFNLILQNGKPMVALETSDAVTKRKMSIEVKATILK